MVNPDRRRPTNNSTKCLLQKENLLNLSVLVYTYYIKICYINTDFTVFNRGNALKSVENQRNLAAPLCAYNIANGCTDILDLYIASMKNTNKQQITTHATVYTLDPFLKKT